MRGNDCGGRNAEYREVQKVGSEKEVNVIEIHNLNKSYDGFALQNVDLQVTAGRIHGFIGQNGAGKTTTIKAMLNMMPLNAGEIKIFGKDFQKDEQTIKEDIGVVFDEMGFHEFMTPKQIAMMMSYVYANWDGEALQKYLTRFGLPLKKPCGKFSRGMRMKLQIAVALSHHAKLLILDEPTSGLDPVVRNEILDIFQEFIVDEEHSIFLSSHIISDLERIADEITFIDKGRILLSGEKDSILEEHAIIRCGKKEAENINDDCVIFKKMEAYGCEILVNDADAARKKWGDALVEPATLEEIMLFYVARENARAGGRAASDEAESIKPAEAGKARL